MPHPSTRQKRLPQRTDYTLIPAPLDLSLPLATEKSPLPAIIVTPANPSSSRDFSIAFLASPPKQTMRQRLASYQHFSSSGSGAQSLRMRALMFLLIVFVVLVCHLVTHSLATRHTHFELSAETGEAVLVANDALGWGDFRRIFGRETEADQVYRDIVGASALGLH